MNIGWNPQTILIALLPVIGAIIVGWLTARYQATIADKNARVENRKVDLSELTSVNNALSGEIQRLREDRVEDEDRHERQLLRLENRVNDLTEARTKDGRKISTLESRYSRVVDWARHVSEILNTPVVRAVLEQERILVPTLPVRLTTPDDDPQTAGSEDDAPVG